MKGTKRLAGVLSVRCTRQPRMPVGASDGAAPFLVGRNVSRRLAARRGLNKNGFPLSVACIHRSSVRR
jgi:hypothetical protein